MPARVVMVFFYEDAWADRDCAVFVLGDRVYFAADARVDACWGAEIPVMFLPLPVFPGL